MPRDVRWVDHSGLQNVSVLVTASSFRPSVSAHLFWNHNLTRVLQMTGGQDLVDAFSYDRVRVLRDGTLLAGGRYVTGPLLVEEYADAVTLGNAKLIRVDNGTSLWQPTGRAQLITLTYGRYLDGWLSARRATISVWPHLNTARRGALCLEFAAWVFPAGNSVSRPWLLEKRDGGLPRRTCCRARRCGTKSLGASHPHAGPGSAMPDGWLEL